MINTNYFDVRIRMRSQLLQLLQNKNHSALQAQGVNENASTKQLNETCSHDVDIGEIHRISPLVKYDIYHNLSNLYSRYIAKPYKAVDNIGINVYDPRVRDIDVALAKYAKKVAEEINTTSGCYTGFKHALFASGVLDDYGDMPKGKACMAAEYLDTHPERFKKLYVKPDQLKYLPAGHIIIYKHQGLPGHAAITTGYSQEMSDCTDNMMWLEWRGLKNSTACVYKLTDAWKFNPNTKKLEFSG